MTSSPGEKAKSRVRAPATAGNLSRPPVMADVARLAGVSHQTVSRVLNEHPNVRPLTRERVLAAIRELAYRPNAAARTLVTRRTHTLGVITTDTMLYGPTSMLYGFERAAHDAYFVSVVSLPALDRRSMLDAVDRFLGQGIEGIIVIATVDTAVAALAHVPPEVPLVAVGCGTRASVTSVAIDNAAGGAAATRHLLGLGHTTVYHVAGPLSCLDAKERVDGWRQALREAGAPVTAVDILPDPEIRRELSEISGWPTIPQVFVKGQLVGGADIVQEMSESGELEELLRDRLGEDYAEQRDETTVALA